MGNTGMTRIVIIAALVLGGIVILASGFGAGGAVAVAPGVTTTPSGSPSPKSTHTTSPGPQLTPKIVGVKFVVFNAGYDVQGVVPGLAAQVQRTLEGDKYVVAGGQNATNAQVTLKKTIVYYTDHGNAAQNQVEAEHVASKYLDNAKVQPLGSDFSEQFPSNAQIIIMLGDDYVTAHGTG